MKASILLRAGFFLLVVLGMSGLGAADDQFDFSSESSSGVTGNFPISMTGERGIITQLRFQAASTSDDGVRVKIIQDEETLLNEYKSYDGENLAEFSFSQSDYTELIDGDFTLEVIPDGGVLRTSDEVSRNGNYLSFSNQHAPYTSDRGEYEIIYKEINSPPEINSTSVSPNPPLIGESASYSASASDSDGNISDLELTVFKDGSQVYQDSVSSSSNTWSDVYTPSSEGSLDARFTATDDAGATTTEWLNRTLSNEAPEINISEPVQGKVYGSQSQNYEAEIVSSGDSKPDENITYTVNLNGQEIDQSSNIGDFNITGGLQADEGNNTLEVTADDGENQASENVSFQVDTTAPEINIESPESFEPDRTDVVLNASVSDPNQDNCYYNLDGGENQSLPNCDNAELLVDGIGMHEVNVYAEDTVGNMASESKEFEADYENSIMLEDSVSGSEIQEFQVGFQSNESDVGAGGSTENGEFRFNTSSLPTGEVTATFTANGYNTKEETFQVDDSFTLSETYLMERSGIFIEAFEERGQEQMDFDMYARNDAGDEYQEYNLSSFERDFNDLPDGFPTGEVEIRIDDAESNYDSEAEYDQFRPREYIVTIDENTRTNLEAQLLERNAGIFVTIEVSDGSGNRVSDALVNVQRNIVDGYTTVSTKKTESDGSTSFYLDPDTGYRALVSRQGYSSFEGTFSPVNYQTEALQIALGTESDYTRSNTWDSIEYSLKPEDNRLNLTGMQDFNFSVTDTESGLEEVGVRLYNGSGDKVEEDSVTGSPSGMSSEIDINISSLDLKQGERLTALGYFVKEGESYKVEKEYTTRKHIVPGMTSLLSLFDNADGFGDTTKGMIALFASILAGTSLKSRVNSKGAGLITLGVLGVFVMVGWFNSFFFLLTLFMLVGLYGTR